jgi:hypothetical protein
MCDLKMFNHSSLLSLDKNIQQNFQYQIYIWNFFSYKRSINFVEEAPTVDSQTELLKKKQQILEFVWKSSSKQSYNKS